MSIPQLDVRVTKYLSKPNAETTKYFTQDSYDIDELEQQVQENTADISLALNEVSNLQVNKESSVDHESDISNFQTQINFKESSSDHAADISNIQNQINNLNLGSPYESLFYFKYGTSLTNPIMVFNYDKGRMIFWENTDEGGYITSVNNADSDYCIFSTTTSLTLPGSIKIINSDGSVNSIVNRIRYDAENYSWRKTLNNLKTITILPDVWKINFDLTKIPNLSSLNLFNGLEKISLSNAYNINYLKIPASVNECSISNCIFMDLSFEPSNIELKLTYTDNRINNKLKIMRKLSSDSSINVSNSSSIDYPPSVLECDVRVLNKIANNSSLSNGTVNIDTFTQLNLRCMAFDNTPVYRVSLNHSLKFNRILVLCQLQIFVGVSNLTANEWYTVA